MLAKFLTSVLEFATVEHRRSTYFSFGNREMVETDEVYKVKLKICLSLLVSSTQTFLQTVWTQIRPNLMSGTIQTVWPSDGICEKNLKHKFWKNQLTKVHSLKQ